jgi:endonuclease/exonuclease/phosphatase family metal-dependent hydrolase
MRALALLAALCAASAAVAAPARAADAAAPEWELRALTYNIHGIMPTAKRDPAAEEKAKSRYAEIAARLRRLRAAGKAPHVVVIQEAFNHWSAKAARDSGYPYILEGNGARFGKIGGSGLFILSEYPVFVSSNMDYKECTGFDCLANKGAMHARVVVPELMRSIDVYNTHMNADEPPAKPEDSMKARMSQIRDFAAFVKRTRDPGAAAVLAGDFNFVAGNADHALFESLLGGTNVLAECAGGACAGDDPAPILRETVDHLYRLDGTRFRLEASRVERTFKEPHRGEPLSDHWGLEARWRLERNLIAP